MRLLSKSLLHEQLKYNKRFGVKQVDVTWWKGVESLNCLKPISAITDVILDHYWLIIVIKQKKKKNIYTPITTLYDLPYKQPEDSTKSHQGRHHILLSKYGNLSHLPERNN